jgi:lysophospholipase L1-like esterase
VGDRIADQMTLWSAAPGKDALECVFMQIGLNDIKGRIGTGSATSADIITELQAAVTTVRASIPASCKIYISGLTPCKVWLDAAAQPVAAYDGWLAVNEAISGSGSTPITGVDGRVTSHVAALNDGSGNLATIYQSDSTDGVHINSEARFIIAQAWRTQLEADGLV